MGAAPVAHRLRVALSPQLPPSQTTLFCPVSLPHYLKTSRGAPIITQGVPVTPPRCPQFLELLLTTPLYTINSEQQIQSLVLRVEESQYQLIKDEDVPGLIQKSQARFSTVVITQMRSPQGQDKIGSAWWNDSETHSSSRALEYFGHGYIIIPDF